MNILLGSYNVREERTMVKGPCKFTANALSAFATVDGDHWANIIRHCGPKSL